MYMFLFALRVAAGVPYPSRDIVNGGVVAKYLIRALLAFSHHIILSSDNRLLFFWLRAGTVERVLAAL